LRSNVLQVIRSGRARFLLRLLSAGIGILLVSTGAASSESWGTARSELIGPLNSTLHSHFPKTLTERDLDGIVGFYQTTTGHGLSWDAEPVSTGSFEKTLRWVTPGQEPIRARYAQILARFEKIDRAELRMDRVDWRNPTPDGYSTTVRLIVRGTGPDGDRRYLEQHATLRVLLASGGWVITDEEVTARTLVTREKPAYSWETTAAGILSFHSNRESPPFRLFGDSGESAVRQGSGVAVADADGDGCEDLALGGSPDVDLYLGRCDGTFERATAQSGLPRPFPAAASGLAFFDYDNDGAPDLFVAAVRGGNRLYHNDGKGHFQDVSASAGIPEAPWTSMATVADYDRDGFVDIYLVGMGDHANDVPEPSYDAANGKPGVLLRNRGDGTFSDVTETAGVECHGWDLAAAWADYDDDGWPDLYIANEFGDNTLFRNQGDGTFSNRTEESGTADGGAGMGVAWGDVDGDGDQDLFVSGMHANTGWALFHPSFPAPIPWYLRLLGVFTDEVDRRIEHYTDKLTRGNSLFRNDGDGTFTDISDTAGVRDSQWSWGAEFLDYDNDGLLDLYAVNGFVSGPILDDV
jgi:hypothetical protein